MKKKFFSNLKFALIAQLLSLTLSIIMSLVLPKILGVKMYSYWQLFVFYTMYINLFHFGICDGIYLRLGGKKYETLNYKLLGTQFYMLLIMQIIVAICIIVTGHIRYDDSERGFVMTCVAVYMIADNGIAYFGMIFQAVNDSLKYSMGVIIDKLLFIIYIIILSLNKCTDYRPFVIGYIVTKYCCFFFVSYLGKSILLQKLCYFLEILNEIKMNICAGMPLMIGAFASNLIVGAARFVVDKKWGIEQFGKFSFSISMTNFFLLFIRQVSMVLFPVLKHETNEKMRSLFYMIKTGLNITLPFLLFFYYPTSWILGIWLPKYRDSLIYLGCLLPLIVFDSKTQMLFITYLKAFREERKILCINVMAVLLSMGLSLIGAYLVKNINFITIALVFVTAIRSGIMEYYISKRYYNEVKWKEMLAELIIVCAFIHITFGSNRILGSFEYLVCYLIYLAVNRHNCFQLFYFLRNRCGIL